MLSRMTNWATGRSVAPEIPELSMTPMSERTPTLTLHPVNAVVCHVHDANGQLVGSLKLVGQRWKFKAIGHTPEGQVVPGGGPFTHRHNTVFDALDAAHVAAGLSER